MSKGEGVFEPGAEVKLVGLSSEALNGLRCIVMDNMNEKGRYPVQLPVSQKQGISAKCGGIKTVKTYYTCVKLGTTTNQSAGKDWIINSHQSSLNVVSSLERCFIRICSDIFVFQFPCLYFLSLSPSSVSPC